MTVIACIEAVALVVVVIAFLRYAQWAAAAAQRERAALLDLRLSNPQTQFVAPQGPRPVPDPPKDLANLNRIGTITRGVPDAAD
ncbi:hypothetical protein NBH00_05230 [Paraconexibacter antarcticus]|uniref:Uncharacterized protein n=1 Tax=Paraconexibacter antarcticus TaxID=2949664 RepID=A0ABY5DUB6_9ACTN|nr:hypothetical protein [Paraconexibacter antarcticus]UTI65613.1 hypothetical protein NBH00_05230 [Paraconexibacter antarcticus]